MTMHYSSDPDLKLTRNKKAFIRQAYASQYPAVIDLRYVIVHNGGISFSFWEFCASIFRGRPQTGRMPRLRQ